MEAEKLNNGNRKSGSCEAGFFYRRIGGINLMTTGNAESGTMKSDALKYRLNGTPLIISCPVMPTMIWCCGSRYLPAILLIISLMSRITSMSLYAVRIYA